MSIRIMEDKGSYDSATFDWNRITHSLEPEIKVLPKNDRRYYNSLIRLIIGKEIRLSNIPGKHIYIYILRGDAIFVSNQYPIIPKEFIRRETGKLLYRLGILISKDGLGWKYGPMGFQQQHMKQEIIQPVQSLPSGGK